MSVPPEQFSRIAGRVNLAVLDQRLVVIVGIGTVGSQIAEELANSGVGRLRLIDGDTLETTNLIRHVLSQQYVGMNKAEALVLHLSGEVPTLRCAALPRYVDDHLSDSELDRLLEDADLIVAATDDRDTQRRIGRRALANDVPAIFPALYGDDGGEVVVQRSPRLPCFLCWDAFRTGNERLRGVTALNADTLALIQLGVRLCLGLLDPASPYARLFVPAGRDTRPRQLFVQNGFALAIRPIERRPDCPACRVGPARPVQSPPRPRTRRPAPEASTGSTPPRSTPTPASQPSRTLGQSHGGIDTDSVIGRLGLLLAACAFLACPFFIILWAVPHLGFPTGPQSHFSVLGLLLIPIGIGCAIWALVGLWLVAASALGLMAALVAAVWRHPVVIGMPILVAGLVVSGVSLPSIALPSFGSHSESITDRVARGVEPCHFGISEWLSHTHAEDVLVCTADPTRRVVMAFYSESAGASVPLEREAQIVGAVRTGTCPQAAPSIHAYYYSNEQRAGSVLCYRRNDHIIYAWSDVKQRRFTKVYFWHADSFKVAQKQWEQLAF
jgi:hypothetical protein